jgi:signal transduction histidine kinase
MLSHGYAGALSPTASDYVQAILESVDRLSKLIDDVLDLTQGDSAGIALERERVDLAGLCRAAVEAFRPKLDERKQKLECDIAETTGTVVGDARRLRESIEHVLENAASYTDRGGKIALKAWGDDDKTIVQVSDNGRGIAAEDQAKVFDRFHGALGTAHSDAALGLGLPLTRQFIEAHGGTVELVSAVGEGTAVTLTIPRAS